MIVDLRLSVHTVLRTQSQFISTTLSTVPHINYIAVTYKTILLEQKIMFSGKLT